MLTRTLARSTITAAEKPSVAGYGSQIEFAHWIVLLGCARRKELDKHKSTQGSGVFMCQRGGPGKVSSAATQWPHAPLPAQNTLTCVANVPVLWRKAGMCFSLSASITPLFDFPTLSLRFIDVSLSEIILHAISPQNDSLHHLFTAPHRH